jgi:hypothetical protein
MKITRNSRYFWALGALSAGVGMAVVACSKVDTVNTPGTDAGIQVAACGTLSPEQAAQIAASQLERFGAEGLAALSGLENSRVGARLLTSGDSNILDPFVADDQSSLHDSLVKLRDQQLVAANVETTSNSSVTFLLRPESVCSSTAAPVPAAGTGGTAGILGTGGSMSSTSLDANCVADNTAHPKRVRITRVACDQGDNVAIELLAGTASERIIEVAFYPDHADLDFDVGAYLRQSYSVTYTYSTNSGGSTTPPTRTEKPAASSASGRLVGSLALVGAHHAKGYASISQAIDVTLTDDAVTHLQFAAAPNLVTFEGNGDAKTIALTVNSGEFDWRTKFSYFIQDFFGLNTTASATAAEPVTLRVAQVQGTLNFDGTSDTVTATNLSLGSAGFTATQGQNALLSFVASGSQITPIDAVITGKPNNDLGIALPKGLLVSIKYGLQPVLALVENPANFIASDTLQITAQAGSNISLLNDPYTNTISVLQSQTGELVQVDSGTLGINSANWPSDNVTVSATQCLTRNVNSSAGHNDLLDDFTAGVCVPQ